MFLCTYSYLPVPHLVQWDILGYIFLLTRSSSCTMGYSCVHILTYPFLILYNEIFLCTYSYLPVPHLEQWDILVYIFLLTRSSSCTRRYSCVHVLTYPFLILYKEIFLCTYSANCWASPLSPDTAIINLHSQAVNLSINQSINQSTYQSYLWSISTFQYLK